MGAECFWKCASVEKSRLLLKQLIPLKNSNKTNTGVIHGHQNHVDKTAATRLSRLLVVLVKSGDEGGERRKAEEAASPSDGHCTHKRDLTAETSLWRPATLFFRSSPWASLALSSSFSCSTCHDIVMPLNIYHLSAPSQPKVTQNWTEGSTLVTHFLFHSSLSLLKAFMSV